MSSPPTLFGQALTAMSERVPGSTVMHGWSVRYLIYLIAIVVVVGVVLLIVDNFMPFLPINPIGPSLVARSVKTFWVNAGQDNGSSENLMVSVSDSPTKSPTNYSMSIQVMVGDSRVPTPGKFRHIVHRGENPCGLTSGTAGTTGTTTVGMPHPPDPTPTTQVNSLWDAVGLPDIMNPGIFLDKYKNDLHVFVHTINASSQIQLESITIEDVPLAEPLTIGVICNGQTLEVYLNCRLYSTLLLSGRPYLPPADNQWFGRYCKYPMSGLIQNLQLWDTAIGSSDYIAMCKPAIFNKENLPATSQDCPAS